jgi:precorrin-2 dehydrogenase/sirohydrochlorin ferrochelatase
MSYMVDLRVANKPVLIVGGGRLAETHAEQLVSAGADLRVIAPELTTGMARLVESADLTWERREFRPDDLAGAFLVLAVTDDPEANAVICKEADAAGDLVYGDGNGFRGNVGLPAVLRRASLLIAVEFHRLPHLARQILLELEEDFSPEWAAYAERLDELLARLNGVPDGFERQRAIHRMTSPAVLSLVRSGDSEEWREHLDEAVADLPERV